MSPLLTLLALAAAFAAGDNADIVLAPWRKLRFEISPRVRVEKRRAWAAAELVQTRQRMLQERDFYRRMRYAAIAFQALYRMTKIFCVTGQHSCINSAG